MNDNDNVDIAMALTGGTSGTLVGYVNAMQEASLDQIPSATDYTWASNDFNAGGRGSGVEILSTDAGVSDARVLLITVTCEGSPCSYTITASTEMEHTVLQLGGTAANVHFVAQHQTSYFKVYLPDNSKDLMISLTALNGDPDLFVSREPFPQCGGSSTDCSACWAAQGLGNETVLIDHSNPCGSSQATDHCQASNYDVGDFFIAVYGFRDSSFTIFANLASETIQLADSVPQNVHTVMQSPFPDQTASQSLVLGFCAESPISVGSASPMINIDSKEGTGRLNVHVYVCSVNSPPGACADTNTGKLSDMHPITSGPTSAAWVGSFTVESFESSGSMILNRTKYESICSSAPCHFSTYVCFLSFFFSYLSIVSIYLPYIYIYRSNLHSSDVMVQIRVRYYDHEFPNRIRKERCTICDTEHKSGNCISKCNLGRCSCGWIESYVCHVCTSTRISRRLSRDVFGWWR